MKHFFCGMMLMSSLISLSVGVSGCSGGGGNKELKYDPKVSEKKGAEYNKEMEEAMKNRPTEPTANPQ